jgi:hypothetical protein
VVTFGGSVGPSLQPSGSCLAPTSCSIQVGSPSVGYICWFHLLHLLGAMVSFDDVDPVHELDLDPEIDIKQEIVFDQEFSSTEALAYLVDHDLNPDRVALQAFFFMHGVTNIDDFISLRAIDFKQTFRVSSNLDTPISISTVLIKKLLSVQAWYCKVPLEFSGSNSPLLFPRTRVPHSLATY